MRFISFIVILLFIIMAIILGTINMGNRGIFGQFFPTREEKANQKASDTMYSVINSYLQEQGENPTVATITNVDLFKNQLFFKDAKNGDKILTYLKANKVILYDPIAKKIINAGTLEEASSSARK